MHGSPCQDFSIAGQQKGANKESGTRSSLMYETLRIVEKLKPKFVIWENVKNVLSEQHKHNFISYLHSLENLGYYNYYQVLNAKDYGVPQNRERIFVISILRYGTFEFPETEELKIRLKDVLEIEVDKKYNVKQGTLNCFLDKTNRNGFVRAEKFNPVKFEDAKIASCVTTHQGQRVTDNFIIGSTQKNAAISHDGISPTLTSAMGVGGGQVPIHNYDLMIRKLTPLECWRLMGFTDEEFKKAEQVNSNTQLYKQAGNSIVVNVLEKILYNLLIKDYKKEDIQLSVMDLAI